MKIHVDKGGELGMSHTFRRACHLFLYVIDDIAPDSSSENGAVEVAKRDIGASLRSLLKGADMSFKYWPYAFRHMIVIEKYVTPSNKDVNHIEAITGNRPVRQTPPDMGMQILDTQERQTIQ